MPETLHFTLWTSLMFIQIPVWIKNFIEHGVLFISLQVMSEVPIGLPAYVLTKYHRHPILPGSGGFWFESREQANHDNWILGISHRWSPFEFWPMLEQSSYIQEGFPVGLQNEHIEHQEQQNRNWRKRMDKLSSPFPSQKSHRTDCWQYKGGIWLDKRRWFNVQLILHNIIYMMFMKNNIIGIHFIIGS